MSKKKVYASLELADQEVRLVVLEVFEGRYNVLRTEVVAHEGLENSIVVDESRVVQAIQKACAQANAALGFRIERVILAIPSINVQRTSQKVHVQVEDGTKSIRLFHVQQGLAKAMQKRLGDKVELVNVDRVRYEVAGRLTDKMPVGENIDQFDMLVDLIYADKETIYQYARCVEQANLEILDLVLDAYAIAQESAVQVRSLEKTMIQLDVEADHTTLGLFVSGRLHSCVRVPSGFSDWIADLQKKHQLSRAICLRLLQNAFHLEVDPEKDKILYIEQNDLRRVEIGECELTTTITKNLNTWYQQIQQLCQPILAQGNAQFIVTGQGASLQIMKTFLAYKGLEDCVYVPQTMGARSASFVCCLGLFYAFVDINRIRHLDKIGVNNNELGAAIDAIGQRSKQGEGGFTRRLKSVILSEEE